MRHVPSSVLAALSLVTAAPAAAAPQSQVPVPDGFEDALAANDLARAQALIAPAADACLAADPSGARCIDLFNWLASVGQRREDHALQYRAARIAADAAARHAPGSRHHYHALVNLASALDQSATPLEAEAPGRQALAIAERLWPAPSDEVAIASRNLAITLTAVGKHREAETLIRRALAVRTALDGPDARATLDTSRVLGVTLYRAGRIGDSIPILAAASAALDRLHPDQLVARASAAGDLASALNQAGRYAEATEHYQRAVTLWDQSGVEGDQLAIALNNAARNFAAMGDYARAERIDRALLNIRSAELGPDNPALARSYANLGVMLDAQGKRDEALPLLRRALALAIAAYGPDHVRTATYRALLADALPLGEQEAERRTLVAIFRAHAGPGHPDTLGAMDALADTLAARNRHAEAEALLREIIAEGERTWGPDNVKFSGALVDLALSLAHQLRPGTLGEIRSLFARAWQIRHAALGVEHPSTIESAIYLAAMSGGDQARTLSRSAQSGILARIGRNRDFSAAEQDQLRGYAPVFLQAVGINWKLAQAAAPSPARAGD